MFTAVIKVPADHPRLRGEHRSNGVLMTLPPGSPPPARGAHGRALARALGPGITPACAGSTRQSEGSRPGSQDHPRLRGEHQGIADAFASVDGSPPPARGAQGHPARLDGPHRITPACAGSTNGRLLSAMWLLDHPRLRGEHMATGDSLTVLNGSPPPARGALAPSRLLFARAGITPACAGST